MSQRRGSGRRLLMTVAGLGVVGAALAGMAVEGADVPPRSLAARLDPGHPNPSPSLFGARDWAAALLRAADRGNADGATPLPAVALGAQPKPVAPELATARETRVASVDAARQAIDTARPGDTITFEPGTYRLERAFAAHAPATADRPIVVRAERPGSVVIEVDTVQAVVVSAPHWTFENLLLRGVCADDGNCEHAFHVVGAAMHFVARNNTVVDFNAHFKINGENGVYPDHGSIEGNTLTATRPRATTNPVTDIDLVAASDWTVRGNRITDFVKADGNQTSYGAYFKGGGAGNRFERNVVVCEDRLRNHAGTRVGLSLGGGGTNAESCRDRRCVTEQDRGVIDSNLVAACSDDGIYLNRAANSVVVQTTLVDTGGIVVRYPESSAVVEGNLVDGPIRSRDGGALHASDNLETGLLRLYLGQHPLRELFVDAPGSDFAWRGQAPRREGVLSSAPSATDLCKAPRPAVPAYGAFEDFSRCRAPSLP